MTWVRIDADFPEHPKVVDLSDDAFRAFIGGLCYCNHYLTDGKITPGAIRKLANRKVADELISAGLWEQNGSGVIVHDFLEYQPTRSEVQAARLQKVEAGRSGGIASGIAKRKAKEKRESERK
jgi:hypothetical protein